MSKIFTIIALCSVLFSSNVAFAQLVVSPNTPTTEQLVNFVATFDGIDNYCSNIPRNNIGIAVQLVQNAGLNLTNIINGSWRIIAFRQTGFSDTFDTGFSGNAGDTVYKIAPFCTNADENQLLAGIAGGFVTNGDQALPTDLNSPSTIITVTGFSTSIWGTSGMFGTVSPMDLTASVADGVVATGSNIWPLFAVIGIALAFVIASYVVQFIFRSIAYRNIEDLRRESVLEQSGAKSNLERDQIEKDYENKIEKIADKYIR